MEDLALIKAVNHLGSFGKNFVMFMKKTELLFTGLGRSVLGKTMPFVLSTARGRRLRAVLKTSCIVFPNTDRPRRANNIYICVPEIELKATGHVKYMYIDLLAFLIGKLRYKGSQSIANRLPRAMLSRST